MPKVQQRSALSTLPKGRLQQIAEQFDLDISPRESQGSFVDTLAKSRRASFEKILDVLTTDELLAILDAHGIGHDSADKPHLQQLILGYERIETDQAGAKRQRRRRNKGEEFELGFREYMKDEEEFTKVHHKELCKGKVADRPHECDLHGVKYSGFFRFLYVGGLVAFILAVAAVLFPEDLGEVKETADEAVASFDPSLVEYSLFIVAGVAWAAAFWGKKATSKHIWVECKHRRTRVKRDDINKLQIAVEDVRAFDGAKWKPHEVWFASTTPFDQDALNFARQHGVRCFHVRDGEVEEVEV